MSKAFLKIFLGLLLSSFLTSCAIHQPMSEMVMFQQKKALSDSTFFSKYSHSIGSFSSDHFLESAVLDYIGYNSQSERKKQYGNPFALTTNLIFLNENHQNLGFSIALAPLIAGTGVDLTYNVFGKYYLTAAGGMGRDFRDFQHQFIFQRRLMDGNPFGLSLGAVWRKNYRYVSITTESVFGSSQDFYSQSFGIRSVFTLSPISEYGSSKLFLHGTGSFNYDITMEAFYPKIGISVGIY
ncbi:hypothetical protein [Gracilimonas sp.]|uniref:hypothetical protein n=1 Tax=Gracilimonas sp. TaxID=1974203 RepID=UPI0032EEB81F